MYRYDAHALAELERIHSSERLQPYILAAGGTLGDGFELYVWNTVIASRFYGSLQAIEVGLRNACHRELTTYFGSQWYADMAFLEMIDPDLRGLVKSAKKNKVISGAGDVVSHLMLGFWTGLFDPLLAQSLWTPVLSNVFLSHAPISQAAINLELEKLRTLRNRIAHLEPIQNRNLTDDVERIERVASWLHPALEKWIKQYDAVSYALASRPISGFQPPPGMPPWPLDTF
jgi:hypothetical protein